MRSRIKVKIISNFKNINSTNSLEKFERHSQFLLNLLVLSNKNVGEVSCVRRIKPLKTWGMVFKEKGFFTFSKVNSKFEKTKTKKLQL